eukprot:1137752-Pelagomonas_calceolata.AAC.2
MQEEAGNLVYAFKTASCSSGSCSVSVEAGQSGLQSVQDGTGRAEDGGEGTAAFQGIMSMVHDPTSNTLYIGAGTAATKSWWDIRVEQKQRNALWDTRVGLYAAGCVAGHQSVALIEL